MKLHLPKLLLAALLAVWPCHSYSAELTGVLDEEGCAEYAATHLTLNSKIEFPGDVTYPDGMDPYIIWQTEDGGTLSGTGSIGMEDTPGLRSFDLDISTGYADEPATVTIERGVTMRNVWLSVWDNTKLVCKNTFHNASFNCAYIDLTDATITGRADYNLESGSHIIRPTIDFAAGGGSISPYRENENFEWSPGPYVEPVIEGNVVLNGNGVVFDNKETLLEMAKLDSGDYGYVNSMTYLYYDKEWGANDFGGFTITGTLTIQSRTAVVFYQEADGDSEGGVDPVKGEFEKTTWSGSYSAPGASTRLILCSSINGSLSNLIPYSFREEGSEKYYYETGEVVLTGGLYVKPLSGYQFYSKAETDGMVGIYLEASGGTGGSGDTDEPGGTTPPVVDPPVTPPAPSDVPTIVMNTATVSPGGYWGEGYNWDDCHLKLNGSWTPPVLENDYDGFCYPITWSGDGNYTMTGSGTIGNGWNYVDMVVRGNGTFDIASTINLNEVEIRIGEYFESAPTLKINGGLTDVEMYVSNGVLDITNARLGNYNTVGLEEGTTLRAATFTVNSTTWLDIYSGPCTLEGNLRLNSTAGAYGAATSELGFNWYNTPVLGAVTFYTYGESSGYGTLHVTGNITVASQTIILFDNDYSIAENGYITEYCAPDDDHVVFTCSSVSKDTLNLLVPVVQREVDTTVYDDDGNEIGGSDMVYFTRLANRQFYAKAGADGEVEIRLGSSDSVSDSTIPNTPMGPVSPVIPPPVNPPTPVLPPSSIVIGGGDTVELGGSEDTTPSTSKPVQIQGGVADASGLDNELLNNKVIQGTGGTLVTGSDQQMSLTGNGDVSYSIVGEDDATPGADIDVNVPGNVTLKGDEYNTAKVTVSNGVLTIDSGTKVGMGSGTTGVEIKAGGSLSNFGELSGDVVLSDTATMLNQNKVDGKVDVLSGATMVNNGVVTKDITVESGALLSGSGSAQSLWLKSGAMLNVGNSPGWQGYDSVTIDRGTQLTFTVDGVTPATATNNGDGTYSVLETETLTIGDGADTVELKVNVTMGIVAAGTAPIELTLIQAGNSNAESDDFDIELNDNGLLEEGAEVVWDEKTNSLTLTGSVSQGALAALMDSNSTNVANMMWASANAVQEMVRTAENQYPIGMPGQTTMWGAGIGGYMNVGGEQGFTSNIGGFAVGLQHAFTEKFRAGVALGQAYGNFKSDDNQLRADQIATMPTLTAQYVTRLSKVSSLSISGHVAYGCVENEADTSQAGVNGRAEWEDDVFNVGVKASWNVQVSANVTASLFAGLNYQQVEQKSFTEKFTGGERKYTDGSMTSVSLPVGITLRGTYEMGGTNVFVPELTVAYVGDIVRDNPEVQTEVFGFHRTGKGTELGRSAFVLSAGANWMFNSNWSMGAFYTLEARNKQVNQSLNASVRYSF